MTVSSKHMKLYFPANLKVALNLSGQLEMTATVQDLIGVLNDKQHHFGNVEIYIIKNNIFSRPVSCESWKLCNRFSTT